MQHDAGQHADYFSVKNLSCGYAKQLIVHDISFSLSKGGFTGIMGPNGAGKTTLFRAITCELKKKQGSVTLQGEELSGMNPKIRAQKLAIVSQKIETAELTVEEYVLMGRLPYQKRFQFIESQEDVNKGKHYMQLTGINPLKDKLLSKLSGGEQQLAAITRALAQEPELLLLDEPTAHLDITHSIQVLNLIQRLNRQLGLSVLMIIHDLNLASEYCDHLILLNQGKVHQKGLPEEVLNYQNIERVYNTPVITDTNPVSGKPVVFLVSERVQHNVRQESTKPQQDGI